MTELSVYDSGDVRRLVLSASLSAHLSRDCLKRGDVERARYYRMEVRKALYRARYVAASRAGHFDPQVMHSRSRLIAVFPKLPQDRPPNDLHTFVKASRPGLRLQRLFCRPLAERAATLAVSGLHTGWAARARKWPMALRSGNTLRETFAASSSAETLACSTQ